MKNIMVIRNIIVATIVIIFLSWAFFKNNLIAKIIILLFLICAIASLIENIALILQKEKIIKICRSIFRISLLIYALSILIYTVYYAFVYKSYSLLIIVALFVLFGINFIKRG